MGKRKDPISCFSQAPPLPRVVPSRGPGPGAALVVKSHLSECWVWFPCTSLVLPFFIDVRDQIRRLHYEEVQQDSAEAELAPEAQGPRAQ